MDELRGTPLSVGSLEEMIDDNHCIVSTSNGPEYYVNILSFVDFDALEPGSKVLLHSKTSSVVGLLSDDTDPMVSVMKVDKAPTETYADIGGLDKQVQEMKVSDAWRVNTSCGRWRQCVCCQVACGFLMTTIVPHMQLPLLVSRMPWALWFGWC